MECIQPGHYLAIRLALQWGVFEALGDVGEKEMSCKQIAEGAGADVRLVGMYTSSRTFEAPQIRHLGLFESCGYICPMRWH